MTPISCADTMLAVWTSKVSPNFRNWKKWWFFKKCWQKTRAKFISIIKTQKFKISYEWRS